MSNIVVCSDLNQHGNVQPSPETRTVLQNIYEFADVRRLKQIKHSRLNCVIFLTLQTNFR